MSAKKSNVYDRVTKRQLFIVTSLGGWQLTDSKGNSYGWENTIEQLNAYVEKMIAKGTFVLR
jgi:hypothetical protein